MVFSPCTHLEPSASFAASGVETKPSDLRGRRPVRTYAHEVLRDSTVAKGTSSADDPHRKPSGDTQANHERYELDPIEPCSHLEPSFHSVLDGLLFRVVQSATREVPGALVLESRIGFRRRNPTQNRKGHRNDNR